MATYWKTCGFVSLFSLLLSAQSVACINIHATDLKGESTYHTVGPDLSQTLRHDPGWIAKHKPYVTIAARRATESPTLENRSDYAACLIRAGEFQPAIEILTNLETEFPGDYTVAANLGTAYELSGDNAQALHWIEQGIERNPSSHDGSEWLHVAILKYKMNQAEHPDAAEAQHVLELNFGAEPLPVAPTQVMLQTYGLTDIKDLSSGLQYQLRERVKFVAAPDPVVADLMFQLANAVAVTKTVEEALPIYTLAQEYGYADESLLQARITKLQEIQAANPLSGTDAMSFSKSRVGALVAILVVFVLLVSAVVVYVVRHAIRALSTE